MANYNTTRCTVSGPEEFVAEFSKLVFVEDAEDGRRFDLSRVVPVPKCFPDQEGVSMLPEEVLAVLLRGPGVVAAWEQLRHFRPQMGPWRGLVGFKKGEIEQIVEAEFPGAIAGARAVARCFGETGYFNVIDWAYGEWGTKWNAFRLRFEEETAWRLHFTFDTANGFPRPIFEKLAKAFPSLRIECLYFDEGWCIAGRGVFNPGADDQPFADEPATKELYALVYGEACEEGADEE
jgi:hypothetical protein